MSGKTSETSGKSPDNIEEDDDMELDEKAEIKQELFNKAFYQSTLHDCSALPPGWKREIRQYTNNSKSIKGKYKTTAYVLKGERYETKYALAEAFSKITKNENGVDLSSFDWKHGRWIRQHHKQKKGLEQLSTELFGKGITDINFTISQPNELRERAGKLLRRSEMAIDGRPGSAAARSQQLKPVIVSIPTKTDSIVRNECPRQETPEYDFDYSRSEGINGTPIEQPAKKRMKQDNNMSSYGPLQVFSMKRLEYSTLNGKQMVPVQSNLVAGVEDSGKVGLPITQPVLPPGMNDRVVGVDKDLEKRVEAYSDKVPVIIDNPDIVRNNYKILLPEETLWKQTMFCLTLDGKPLPSSAIWGQNKENWLRISKVPDVFINALQPFVKNFTISKEIIAEQAKRVRKLRSELATVQNELRDLEKEEIKLSNEDVSDIAIFGKKEEDEDQKDTITSPTSIGNSDEVTIIE